MVRLAGVEPACIQLLFQRFRKPRRYSPMNKCLVCQKQTSNPKFCSRSCAGKLNNSLFPKREKKTFCVNCKGPAPSGRKYCRNCWSIVRSERSISFKTKQQAMTSDTQRYRKIRAHARKSATDFGLLNECAICRYTHHVETCHLVPIQAWPDEALVSEINQKDNLIGLCPNHHWELDHGLLQEIPHC